MCVHMHMTFYTYIYICGNGSVHMWYYAYVMIGHDVKCISYTMTRGQGFYCFYLLFFGAV